MVFKPQFDLAPAVKEIWNFFIFIYFFPPLRKNVDLTIANQKTTDDLTKVKGELVTKDKQLETNKVQIDKLKQLGRTLKSKNEGYAQEITR